jgi:glycosyltransferase involved in cell wall biosynthesis
MRLLIITPLYPPAVGGAATYFAEIVPRLAKQDDVEEILVLTECLPGQPARSRLGKIVLWRVLPTRVSRPRRTWLGHAVSYGLTQLWFAVFLSTIIRREHINLVHFHTRFRGRLFVRALRRLPVPVIADMRDRLIAPSAWAGAYDRILVCAESIRDFALAQSVPPDRLRLIANAFTPPPQPTDEVVRTTLHRLGLGPEPFLLYVGDLNANKGVYELLEAFRQPLDDLPAQHLVVAGPNREGQRFEAALGKTSAARYLGVLSHADVLALMAASEAVVLPSRSEGLPTVLLEALALGTRVVCPPGVPEFARWLPECVIPEITPDAIRQTIARVLASPAPTGYPLAHHHPDRVVAQLIEVYHQVSRDPRPQR